MDGGPPVLDRRWSRRTRLAGVGLVTLASSVAVLGLFLPIAVRAFVRGIELTLNACVWLATSLSVGMSAWSVLRVIARHAVTLMVSRQATALLMGLVLIGAAAAYALQRILGSEEESP
jgi:hypothetical protein